MAFEPTTLKLSLTDLHSDRPPVMQRPKSASSHMIKLGLAKAVATRTPPASPSGGSFAFPVIPGSPKSVVGAQGLGSFVETLALRPTTSTPSRSRSPSPAGAMTMADKESKLFQTQQQRASRKDLHAALRSSGSSSPVMDMPSSPVVRARTPSGSPMLRVRLGSDASSVSTSPSPKPSPSGASLTTSFSFKASSPYRESGHIPGYAGHVPGYDHVAGRSFAKATRRALERDHIRLIAGEAIPSPPHANPKIHHPGDVVQGHIPGYAGHVPDYANKFGTTFTKCTSECPHADISAYGGLRSKLGRKAINVLATTPVHAKQSS